MNATTRKLWLLLVLVVIWAVVWHARLHGGEFFWQTQSPVNNQTVPASPAATPPAPSATDGIAPILATIDWADPGNPVAIPLSGRDSWFLFETKNGLQVWNSDSRSLLPLQAPAADVRLIEKVWMRAAMRMQLGTLFAVNSGQAPGRASLYWTKSEQPRVEHWLELPADFTPSALVHISDNVALVCAKSAQHAMLVKLSDGQIKQMAASSDLQTVNLWDLVKRHGIVGPVAGFDELFETGIEGYPTHMRPLKFDTRDCAWKARALPEFLAGVPELEILPQFTRAGTAIVAASWRDPSTGRSRTLDTPLLWNDQEEAWRAGQSTEFTGIAPAQQSGIGAGDWSYAADVAQGRFAFLAQVNERWREAEQRFPAADGLKLLPIGNEGVLALLIDAKRPGRIVRLDPEREKWFDARFPHNLSGYEAAISMTGGAMMLVGGLGGDAMMVKPDATHIVPLPDLPQFGNRYSGVQLSDGSVIVFGGLQKDCYVTDLKNCDHSPRNGFRWLPAEKRWQSLPTLNVPFAFGDSLDGGNSSIASGYMRRDFTLRGGSELYYLSGNEARDSDGQRVEPTTLYRWRLDDGTRPLARTRLSRYNATLVTLDDGRLAAIGGSAADETPASECRACQGGDDEDLSKCDLCTRLSGERFNFARSCEIYDPATNRWSLGPTTKYPRGRAVKLANGRIFKFSLLGYNARDAGYAAETADPALVQWGATQPFPLHKPATVRLIQAVGNQVLIIMDSPADRYVIWDDESRSWQVRPLPRNSDWVLGNQPIFVSTGADGKILMIYSGSFEYLAWPQH